MEDFFLKWFHAELALEALNQSWKTHLRCINHTHMVINDALNCKKMHTLKINDMVDSFLFFSSNCVSNDQRVANICETKIIANVGSNVTYVGV